MPLPCRHAAITLRQRFRRCRYAAATPPMPPPLLRCFSRRRRRLPATTWRDAVFIIFRFAAAIFYFAMKRFAAMMLPPCRRCRDATYWRHTLPPP